MERDGEGGLTVEQKAAAWDQLQRMIDKLETHPNAAKFKPIHEAFKFMMLGSVFLARIKVHSETPEDK